MSILNHDLDLLKTDPSVKRITAITIFDDIYILAENLSIKFFNKRFLMINEFTIDKPAEIYTNKGIDDIVIFNNHAYLLDDLRKPLYIYRFKLPSDLKETIPSNGFLHLYYFSGIRTSLPLQFLTPEQNSWGVVSFSTSIRVVSQNILLFDLYKTDELIDEHEQFIYQGASKIKLNQTHNIYDWDRILDAQGHIIIDILRIAPNFCIAFDESYHLALYELKLESEGAKFKFIHLLYANTGETRIEYYDKSFYIGKLYRKGHFLYGWYRLFYSPQFFVFNLKRSTLDMNVEHDDFIMMDSLVNIEIRW